MITDRIKKAEDETELNPTENQKISGNYKKGKVTIDGLKITIENPKGSFRSGVDENGEKWSVKMKCTYGYFNGTLGVDGDQVDVFLGDDFDKMSIYVIDQINSDKTFDEHKVMFGFSDIEKAKKAYLSCYSSGWEGLGNITEVSLSNFKKWLKDGSLNKYPIHKVKNNSKMKIENKNVDNDDGLVLIKMYGEVEMDVTLNNLKKQAGEIDNINELILEIASQGGSVSEGLNIMLWLNMLSEKGIKVTTVVVANAYSIASLIMLAAPLRLISKYGEVMVHNPMIPELKYINANDLETHIEELRSLEKHMYELYEMFTGLETEKIKELMDNETFLKPSEAVELGFADMEVDIKPRAFKMALKEQKTINMNKTLNALNRIVAKMQKEEFVNQIYSDKDGVEIEIFQTDPSMYAEGDRTSKESGVFELSDGSKITVENFLITKIEKGVTESENSSEGEAPKDDTKETSAENTPEKIIEKTEQTITTKEVKNTEIQEQMSWEISVVNETFEVGDKVEYKPTDDYPEANGVGVGEFKLADGRKILTDSESIIRIITPASETTTDTETANENNDSEEDVADTSELEAKLDELEAKNKELEAKLSEVETKAVKESEDVKEQLEAINKMQLKSAEAIELISNNTVSKFVPKRALIEGEADYSGMSIFQIAKAKAKLKK